MYDHYIALDWAQSNMAVARMTGLSERIQVFEGPAKIKNLQDYLKQLRGRKIFTLEESTSSQWLYTELKDFVDELIVCDPYRNRLLIDGPKTDKIDGIDYIDNTVQWIINKVAIFFSSLVTLIRRSFVADIV